MNRTARLLALSALLVPGAGAQAPQAGTTFRVEAPLVNVFVSVTDRAGAPITNLVKDDFRVEEDGRPQTIAVFERDTSVPLAIVLAVDLSGSTYKDFASERRAAGQFVRDVLRPQDRADLLGFSDSAQEVTGFTADAKRLAGGLSRLRPGPGGTALYNAVASASQLLRGQPGRRVLLLISDGDNTVDDMTYRDALDAAVRAQVLVYSIIDVPVEASAGRDTGGEHALIALSEQSGGRAYYASQSTLDRIFRRVSDDLRSEYLLGYYPPPPGAETPPGVFHSIRVTMASPAKAAQFSIRSRPGYFAGAAR